MTRKQEINAIYDRLCWMLCGAFQGKTDPETCWEFMDLESLSRFIITVNDVWELQEAGSNLMNCCYIEQWRDFERIAEFIYNGGGRVNKPMDARKSK